MTKQIVYPNILGGVSVVVPFECGLTVEQIAEKDVPKGTQYKIFDVSELPADYDFFDAWEMANGNVTVSFSKAQNMTKDRLRRERAPLLVALDVAFQRALEIGVETSFIVSEKQRLRDITKLADEAKTLDELRALEAK